jgi:hypothetical protein
VSNAEKAASREGPSQVAGGHRQFWPGRMANVHKRMKVWHAHCFHGERGARAECDCTVCTQLQCIMSNNVVVVSKSDAGVDMKGLGFKL